jgi:glutaredoxin 3
MKVIIYTTSWCPHCKAVKDLLRKHKIKFTEHDVEENNEKWQEAMKKANGADIVPVVDIDGKIFYGDYDDMEEELKKTLNIDKG